MRQRLEQHETVIVGGGQAGLVMSWHLAQLGRPHVVLERARVAERWRSERWESLAFQIPNGMVDLPGLPMGGDPEGFATAEEIVRFIERFQADLVTSVQCGVEVTSMEPTEEHLHLETTAGPLTARNVVIATGPFHHVRRPALAAALRPDLVQVDAAGYRSPRQLPPGAVLVVGSGSSGMQIAEELVQAGRRVFLSVGRHRQVPRRYRGQDVIWWYDRLGRFDVPVDTFPDRRYPPPTVMTGVQGGHDLTARGLADAGVILLGRVNGLEGDRLEIGDDVNAVVDAAEASCADFLAQADALAERLQMPGEPAPPAPKYTPVPAIRQVDLRAEGVSAVIWATGYSRDDSWVRLPLFDAEGRPQQERGVTAHPGVYFLGLHWMHTFRSGLLAYVTQDAGYIAGHMQRTGRIG